MIGEIISLLPALAWAITPILYRRGTKTLSPIYGNTLRAIPSMFIALAASFLYLGVNATLSIPTQLSVACIISGVVGLGLGDLMYLYSIKHIGASKAVTISSTYPIITLVASNFLLGEGIGWFVVIGTVFAVAGISLISFNDNVLKLEVKGILTSTLASVFWSMSIILLKITPYDANVLAINSWRLVGFCLFSMIPSVLLYYRSGSFNINKDAIIYLGSGSIIALNLGWFLFLYGIDLIGIARATTLSSVSPLFTAVAEFIMNRHFDIRILLGTILTTVGIVLVTI